MGSELGLSEVVAGRYTEWLQDANSPANPLEPDGNAPDADYQVNRNACQAHLLARAMPIPGMLHILDNCAQVVHDRAMPHWPEFLPTLREVCSLLTCTWVRERFLGRCVIGPSATQDRRTLNRHFEVVTQWRWGSLLNVLRWLDKVKPLLRHYWNVATFLGNQTAEEVAAGPGGRAGQEKAAGIDVHAITDAISSPFFWSYASVLLHLELLQEDVRSWAEGCQCHGFRLR